MSFQNFIPTVWAEAINRELEKTLVFAEDCNRKYEGNVSKKGDSVRILGVARPTITTFTDKDITLAEAEEVSDSSITMIINQVSTFHYKVGDIDKHQAVGGVMEALNAETSQALADEMDKHIAAQAAAREAVKYSASAVALTKENVLYQIDAASERLYTNNVRSDAKIVMTVPPWMYMIIKQAYIHVDTDNSDMLKNGRVGRYGNIIIKMSNNVAKNAAGDSLVMVRTPNAVAFCNPMTHTEAYRPERKFVDAVKGFVLYESKIVRPKEMIIMNVKRG